MKLNVLHTTGKSTTITVSDSVFAASVNKPLIAQAVRVFLSNQRQGTAKTKTRAEVNRSKKKWFKQKGTGNARHGARTPSLFVGGGVTHGPRGIAQWDLTLPKAMKRKALMSALSSKSEQLVVTTVFEGIKPKTKDAVAYIKNLAPDARRVLIVVATPDETLLRSTNNIANVLVTTADHLNIHEILLADRIIFTKEAVKAVESRLLGSAAQEEKEESVEGAPEIVVEAVAVKPKKVVKKVVKKKESVA